jgi:cytochrome c oxidase cbb3-type subunit III
MHFGINSAHPDSHSTQMPAFGRDGLLSLSEIAVLTDHVRTLGAGVIPDDPSDGAMLFLASCAGCHGAEAKGIEDTGAPKATVPCCLPSLATDVP